MNTAIPAWFILSGAASLAALAAQSTQGSSPEIIGRLPAEPDVVLEWNAAVSAHFEEFSLASTPHLQARVYAMVHLAMRDAIAAATREARQDAGGVIAKAAANAAAHDVLVALRPAGVNRFGALQTRHVAALTNEVAASRGRQIGQRIAASVLSNRAGDGWPIAPSESTTGTAAIDPLRPGAEPTPFVLKRAQQFESEPPYFAYSDGVVVRNYRLRSKKLLGTPAGIAPDGDTVNSWRTEAVVRWNCAARSLALQHSQDPSTQARLFASLNAALADALLSATYWSQAYSNGRMERPYVVSGPDVVINLAAGAGGHASQEAGRWWVAMQQSGFPAIAAALAGAAETVLRGSFGREVAFVLPAKAINATAHTDFTNLQSAARQCAWSALVDGGSTPEGCVAGYDLGSRIAAHVLKQGRR